MFNQDLEYSFRDWRQESIFIVKIIKSIGSLNEMTHHPDQLQVISKKNRKKKLQYILRLLLIYLPHLMLAKKDSLFDALHQLTSEVVGSDQVMIRQLTRGCG